jgi:hypothetical protein
MQAMAEKLNPAIVVSIATDEIRELRELTFPNKQAYCDRHGYFFAGFTRSLDPDRPASWSKLNALALLCKPCNTRWALWTDADTLIIRPDWKIEEVIDNDFDFIVAQDHNGMNCGVFLLRLGPDAHKFLFNAQAQIQFINHRWWEQAAIRFLIEKGYPIRTKFIDKRIINAYPSEVEPGVTAIVHVPDHPKTWPDRMGELKKFLPKGV